MFNREMLELLVCPISHSALRYDAGRDCLIGGEGQYCYPIVNGIPVLMPVTATEAQP